MIQLYDYQDNSVNQLNERFTTEPRALMVMASGLGKTITSAAWTKQHVQRGRGLFLCHENYILEQALGEYRKVLGQQVSLGLFHGFQKDFNETHVLFASLQSMREWHQAFLPHEFYYVIVDESHHGQAPSYKEVIQYFKPTYLLGMTATPDRMDQKNIREIFGEEVVNIPLEYAIGQEWLTPVEYHLISDNLNTYAFRRLVEQATKTKKRVSMKQLNETIFVQARDEKVAEIVLSHQRKGIIFCESILHAEHLQQFFPDSQVYHSRCTPKENRTTLEAFRNGNLQNILVIDKFNEGIDIPDTELIAFMRCTDSKTVFTQQLGRGLRKKEGKDNVIVLDFVANAHRVAVVQDMAQDIARNAVRPEIERDLLYISGKGFHFNFSKEQVDILDIIERMKLRYVSDIPHLFGEYSDKNLLPPHEVPAGTSKKLQWICNKCGYEWIATGSSRYTNKCGCPSCGRKIATEKNNLTLTDPNLAAEYSPNNSLPVDKVLAGTRKLIWWVCGVCSHEWQASGESRKYGKGKCPTCNPRYGKKIAYKATLTNNIVVTHPHLAIEYSWRNKVPVVQVLARTHKKIWWVCRMCGNEWQATGQVRAQGIGKCKKCQQIPLWKKLATPTRNLAATHPDLAIEYSDKNDVPANKIIAGTRQVLWWVCSKCGNEWQAKGSQRIINAGRCPQCTLANSLAATHPYLIAEYSAKNKLPIDRFTTKSQEKLWWTCLKCGREWRTSAYYRSVGHGCASCSARNRWRKP